MRRIIFPLFIFIGIILHFSCFAQLYQSDIVASPNGRTTISTLKMPSDSYRKVKTFSTNKCSEVWTNLFFQSVLEASLELTDTISDIAQSFSDTIIQNQNFPEDFKHQSDSTTKWKEMGVFTTQAVSYTGNLTWLYYLYYKDYSQSTFHFFNDNSSWLQMDKAGHLFTTYTHGRILYSSYRWAGIEKKKAILYSSLSSYVYMLSLEIYDGFSDYWGFSPGDIAANTAGCLLFAGQQMGWDEQRFLIKYSFRPSIYSKYAPETLGENFFQNIWEDNNGMTYWLSGNISSFLPKQSVFPKWLNVSFGYGANGLAVSNIGFDRYRQFYLSLDVDLTRIPTKSKALKVFFTFFNFIKIPFPALEYNTLGKMNFHYLYP